VETTVVIREVGEAIAIVVDPVITFIGRASLIVVEHAVASGVVGVVREPVPVVVEPIVTFGLLDHREDIASVGE